MLKFDEIKHEYTLNGKRLPSVTQIISRVVPRKWFADEFVLHRGSMVHKAVALYLQGSLDMDTVDDRIRGRVESIIKAVQDNQWKPFATEQYMASKYGFAGTPDMITQCGVLVDWKATIEATAELQLGFYSIIAEENKISVKNLRAVRCNDDGSYSVKPFDLRRAKGLALACWSMYGWMVKNKIGEE